jgi:arsenite methyltransferase
MPPEAIVTNSDAIIRSTTGPSTDQAESLFEHVAWLYAFCREKVFRDDTDRIIAALWSKRAPDTGEKVIELGCGPGFYSRNLAQRFPQILVTGVDRSEGQILRARRHAQDAAIANCAFEQVNALQLPCEDANFDVLIASRLFTILYDPNRAVAEMYRVLKRDGRCFIAEPRYAIWASIPLFAMWLLALTTHARNGYREPHKATVYSEKSFTNLFARQPWKSVSTWHDGRYQYALCQKA